MPREVDKREPWQENGLRFEIAILKLISCSTGVCGNLRIEDMVQKQWQQTSKKRRVAGDDSDDDDLPRYDTSDKTFEYFNKVLHVAIEHINMHLDAEANDKTKDETELKAGKQAGDKADDKADDKAETGGDQDAGWTPFMSVDDMRTAFFQKLEGNNAKKDDNGARGNIIDVSEVEDNVTINMRVSEPQLVRLWWDRLKEDFEVESKISTLKDSCRELPTNLTFNAVKDDEGIDSKLYELKASASGSFQIACFFRERKLKEFNDDKPDTTLTVHVAGDDAKDAKKSDEKAEAEAEDKALRTACSPAFVKAVEKADLKRKLDEILADESSMTSREKLARIEAAFDVDKAERDDTMRVQFKQALEMLSESCARLRRAVIARDAAIAENLVLKALTLDMMQQRNAGAAGAKH